MFVKREGRKYMFCFTTWNVQSAVTCESERVPSHKFFCFGISKLIPYFPNFFHVPCILHLTVYFHVPCTVLYIVYFNTVISMFCFLCCWPHSIANAVNKLCFYWRFTIADPLQAAAVENEEQHTLINIIYTKFHIVAFFLWNLFWRRCF